MNQDLLDLMEPRLSPLLASWGFLRTQLKVAGKARAYMGIRRGGLGYARRAAVGGTEFIYFQRGSDRLAVAGFAGWSADGQIPAPRHAFDFPTPDRGEMESHSFVFPVFTLLGSRGFRLNAERLEGDEWLLAPAGPIPHGGDDAALAAGIAAQLRARLAAQGLSDSADPSQAARALAARVAGDLRDTLIPYFAGRVAPQRGAEPR